MDRRRCPLCRAQTLAGTEDRSRCALPYRLDPVPLAGALDELLALRAGRRTWTVHDSGHVSTRTARDIGTRPPGQTPHWRVHADHVCEGDRT